MLSEDQRTRLRALSIGAALVWIALGLISGWPAWVWIALAVASAFVPTIVAYVQAERVLRRSGRGARRRSARRSRAAEDSDEDSDGEGGTLNAQESAPAAALAADRAPAPRREATAADHALALVAALPPSQRHRFARDLARLLDDNELRTAARAVRQERAEAVRQEDARPARSGATGASRVSGSPDSGPRGSSSPSNGSPSSGSPGTESRSSSSPSSTGSRNAGAHSAGARNGPAVRSSGRSIAEDADPDDVVLAGVSPENRSAVENFLDARPRIHMPEPPAERVPARDSHDEADEDDDG
ncbi:hypothetical protein [Bounagaea algeriensis]